MGENKSIAISENQINRLIFDVNDYAIKARKIFDEIESIVNNTYLYYDCNCITNYKAKFNDFKLNFPIMVNNILTYKTDMQNLKFKFAKNESVLSDVLLDEAKNALSKKNN